jgi:hypothetical protein
MAFELPADWRDVLWITDHRQPTSQIAGVRY